MSKYIITTKRLGLRRWLESDIEPFAKMNRDDDVMKFFPKKLNREETMALVERISVHFDNKGFGLFAVEDKQTQEFIGFTGFSVPGFESFFTPCIEIGWRFKKEAWGNGFATEAAMACLEYGFRTLDFNTIVSFTSFINIKSVEVMKRIGMRYIANFNHPKIEEASMLCEHVLYEISKENYCAEEPAA